MTANMLDLLGQVQKALGVATLEAMNRAHFHHRADKLLELRKPFLVVSETEPYYLTVYDMIRHHEIAANSWGNEDEDIYLEARARKGYASPVIEPFMRKPGGKQ